ncbi:MAG: trimethylamine methyltransferase family protein, partial [Anaerovorax sp.]
MKFFEYLDKEDLDKIHQSTLILLEKTGIRCRSERFLQKAAEVGLKVDDVNGEKVIFFPIEKVAEALASAPCKFSTFGRNPKYEIKWGERRAYNRTCVGTPFIKDVETCEKHIVTQEDMETNIRVCDGLEFTDIVSCIVSQEVPQHAALTIQAAAMVKNTTKPLRICIDSPHEVFYVRDVLATAVGGKEQLKKQPLAYLEISPISPMDYSDSPAEALLDILETGLPLGIVPAPMMGATGPMTMIGSVTMHNAEILAGIVIAQLIKPGYPCIMSPHVTFMDMATAMTGWGAPEMGLAAAASAQMGLYYDLPTAGGGKSVSAKITDEQTGYESMFNSLLPALSGMDVIGGAGAVDNALVACYRKLAMDNEVSSMTQFALKKPMVDDDTMAVDVVHEVVNGEKNFLG